MLLDVVQQLNIRSIGEHFTIKGCAVSPRKVINSSPSPLFFRDIHILFKKHQLKVKTHKDLRLLVLQIRSDAAIMFHLVCKEQKCLVVKFIQINSSSGKKI